MQDLKAELLEQLRSIDGLEDRSSPVAGGTALFYRGKEFAHFHHDNELDLKLTTRVIRELGLQHPPDSVHHPNRSKNSAWFEVRYASSADVSTAIGLVRRAIAQL